MNWPEAVFGVSLVLGIAVVLLKIIDVIDGWGDPEEEKKDDGKTPE